jgi:hypothetical protein
MNSSASRRETRLPVMLVLGLAFAGAAAHAGSTTVRDGDGSRWQAIEDPDDDKDDYLVQRIRADRKPDPRFGHEGGTAFQLGPDNDTPTSLRVEAASHRVWVAGATSSGGRTQAVVMRFDATGNADPRWGVQGRMQAMPSGLPVKPADLMPLSDGSVLVAGEVTNPGTSRATVFHLKPDGSVDISFGIGGVWQRPGAEQAAATSFAVGPDGGVAVSVSVRGSHPSGEIWSLGKVPPVLVSHEAMDDGVDEDDARIEWMGDHFAWNTQGGATQPVPAASLVPRAMPAPVQAVTPASGDLGGGAYNPFAEAAPSAARPARKHEDDGIPWLWIAVAAGLALGLTGLFFKRTPAPATGRNAPRRR